MSLSLKAYLDHSDNETGIGCYHALTILLRLSYCLNYLYQFEIVHNDLKLDNIMIVKEETPKFNDLPEEFEYCQIGNLTKDGKVIYEYFV